MCSEQGPADGTHRKFIHTTRTNPHISKVPDDVQKLKARLLWSYSATKCCYRKRWSPSKVIENIQVETKLTTNNVDRAY